jgi:predicted heme/steroid binding protein
MTNALTSSIATVTITVNDVNDAPVAAEVEAQEVDEGSTLTVNLAAADPDGNSIAWSIIDAPAGAGIGAESGVFTWTPLDGDADVSVTVRATDSGSPALWDEVTFAVHVADAAPVLALTGADTADGGVPYTLTYTVTDPGQDTISSIFVDWGDGHTETIAGNPGSLTHTYAAVDGSYDISITPTDEDGTHSAATRHVEISANDAPVATDRILTLSEDGSFSSPWQHRRGSDPLTYGIVSGPAHGTLSELDPETHQVTYTPQPGYFGTDSFVSA